MLMENLQDLGCRQDTTFIDALALEAAYGGGDESSGAMGAPRPAQSMRLVRKDRKTLVAGWENFVRAETDTDAARSSHARRKLSYGCIDVLR
jgi:hypothetical protein